VTRAALGVVVLALAGCAGIAQPHTTPVLASADLRDAQGRPVGTATLSQVGTGVHIILEVRGLPPGPKGVHLHAVGKCDPPDFASAGPHFNPDGKQHGLQSDEGAHAGDLPNITIAPDGNGRLESMNERITLGAGLTSLFDADGTALVIHAAPDDFRTDPTGNSGARLACGLVGK
jgi:Cu-Zn family superoxide dismutase